MEAEKELGFHNPQKDPLEQAADKQLEREQLRGEIKQIQEGKEKIQQKSDLSGNKEDNTEKEKPKKESKTKKAISKIIMIILFVAIVGGVFWLVKPDNDVTTADMFTYPTGFSFVEVQNYWVTRIEVGGQDYDIPFRYNPYEVENITVEGDLRGHANAYKNYKYTYLTLDDWDKSEGHMSMSVNEISKIFAEVFKQKVIAACTSENRTGSCLTYNFTTKTCNNTNEPVIYLKSDPEVKLIGNGNCIIVQGQGEDLIRATDKLFYRWFGVMKAEHDTIPKETEEDIVEEDFNETEEDSVIEDINETEIKKENSTIENNSETNLTNA